MRTFFLAVLFLCATVSFAAEWIEFQPPQMDDVTVDPLRFTQEGKSFDLSDPAFKPIEHGQSCKATRSDGTTKEKLVVDYEFTGKEGLEYLEIKTNITVEKPGFNLGGIFKTLSQEPGSAVPVKAGAIRVRLMDPSGETHQHTLGQPNGIPIFAKIEKSPGDIWGGDGDKQLQFPCRVVSVLLDKPEKGFKGKGTLEITGLALYEAVELRDALKIEFAADSPPGLLFTQNTPQQSPTRQRGERAQSLADASGSERNVLKLRLTPKNLKDDETLLCFPDDRTTQMGRALDEMVGEAENGVGNPPFIDADRITINGIIVKEKQKELEKEIANSRSKDKDDFLAPMMDAVAAMILVSIIPKEGAIVEIPIAAPGAIRAVFVPHIAKADPKDPSSKLNLSSDAVTPCVPVMFSFGAIKPNTPLDSRLGVCTHYQQGWNTNSLDFVAKAGFGMIRDEMTWSSTERKKGELEIAPRWNEYVDKAIQRKIDPLVILDYSNRFYDDNGFPVSDEAVAGFANYGKFITEQFKGRVKYFEVWNEWTGGCGMGHVKEKKTNTPENYVKLLKATYEAVKAANPEAYVIGGGGDHSAHQLKQIEGMFEAGALKYCDAFSVHPYRQPRDPESSNLVDEVVHVADLMKKHGVKEPKLWITEIGWPTPKKHPAKDAELFQAAMVVRSAVPLLATGVVEKYFWYDLKNDGLDRIDQEHNFGVIRNDKLGLQVKPGFVAFAVMSANTAGRNILPDEKLSKDGVLVYRLQKAGESDRLVLWTTNGEKTVRVENVSSATNLFGTPLHFDSKSMTLTDEPIWVVLK